MEQAVATELKSARLVVHKLNHTFDSFQSHAFSIASLSDQWHTLQASFSNVEAALWSRVKELDSKDRLLVASASRVENLHKEVQLKESSVVARLSEVELREKEIKEFYEGMELEKKRIRSHCEALKCKEKKIFEGLSRVRVFQEELKCKEVGLDSRFRVLELKEAEIGVQVRDLESKEAEIGAQVKDLELREAEMSARFEGLELREAEIGAQVKGLELKEMEMSARFKDLELREAEIGAQVKGLEVNDKVVKERVMNEHSEVFMVIESDLKERLEELKVKGDEMIARFDVRCKEVEDEHEEKKVVIDERLKDLELKEKELKESVVSEHLEVLWAMENDLKDRFEELKVRGDEIMARFDVRCKEVEVENEEKKRIIDERLKDLELKEKELGEVFVLKEKEMDEVFEQLELRRKELEVEEEERKAVIDERLRNLELKEKELGEVLVLKEKEMDGVFEQLELRRKELELEEEERKAVIDTLALKEDQMEENFKAKEVKISECLKLLESEEKVKRVRCKEIELKLRKFKEQWNKLETKEKQINESLGNLELKEKKLRDDLEALELKEKQLDKHCKEMELKEKEMKERGEMIEKQEKQIIRRGKVQELIAKDLELSKEENGQLKRMLETREEEDKKLRGALELKEKEIDDLLHSLELLGSRIGHCERLELKESEINELSRRLELSEEEENQQSKEKQNDEQHSRAQSSKESDKSGNYPSVEVCSLCTNMNANGLRSYLNNHVNDHNLLHEDILSALRCAPDPAKLVLNVCRDFHETDLTKQARHDNKSSCIYLLELLSILNPNITPSTRTEARKLADIWMPKWKRHDSAPADSFGFLQLLAAYKLAGLYKVEDMLLHLTRLYSVQSVYLPEKHVALCNVLGIVDRIPDCIESLIERNKRLDAVKLICVFKMEDSFPLGPLLKDHVECVIRTANEMRRTKNRRAKIRASEKEHYFLVAVLKCIYEFKLTSHYRPLRITRRIKRLQKEKKIKNNALKHTQKMNTESHIRNSFATSVNDMAESNSYIKESSIPTSPTDVVTESMTRKKRNASSTLSVTHPEFSEKRPRVEVPNQQHASEAPWLNHGPSIYGHPPQPNPDVCWAGPHGPFLAHNGSHPYFAGPSGGFMAASHLSTIQFAAPIPYSVDHVAHLGSGRTWEQPDMH